MRDLVNIPFENKFGFGFAFAFAFGLVLRVCPCPCFICGRSRAGSVTYTTRGPVPTTKLHRCAEGPGGRGITMMSPIKRNGSL